MVRTYVFRDILSGVRINVIEGWSPYFSNWYLSISSIKEPLKSYGVAVIRSDLDNSIKRLLLEIENNLRSLNIVINPRVRVEKPSNTMRLGERIDTLPGDRVLVTRFKANISNNKSIIYFWQYIEGDNNPPPSLLEKLVDTVVFTNNMPSYKVAIRDANNTPAFTVIVPRYWMHNGFVNAIGELVFTAHDQKSACTLNISSSYKYFYLDNPWTMNDVVQLLLAQGYEFMAYKSLNNYILDTMGIKPGDTIDVSPPQFLAPYIGDVLVARSMGFYGIVESKIVDSSDKVLWVTSYGYQLPLTPMTQSFFWNVQVSMITGLYGSDFLRDLLMSIISHIKINPSWIAAKRRELSRTTRSIMRSIRSIRVSYPASTVHTSYNTRNGISEETNGYGGELSDSLGSLWDSSGDDGNVGERGLSEYDWASGQGVFYIDSEGRLRSYDYAEEVVADHINDIGEIIDENGNPLGRIEEGYIYDSEGNRIGRIDEEASDEWWIERYEQEIPEYDRIMGHTIFGANTGEEDEITPYYVSKYKKKPSND